MGDVRSFVDSIDGQVCSIPHFSVKKTAWYFFIRKSNAWLRATTKSTRRWRPSPPTPTRGPSGRQKSFASLQESSRGRLALSQRGIWSSWLFNSSYNPLFYQEEHEQGLSRSVWPSWRAHGGGCHRQQQLWFVRGTSGLLKQRMEIISQKPKKRLLFSCFPIFTTLIMPMPPPSSASRTPWPPTPVTTSPSSPSSSGIHTQRTMSGTKRCHKHNIKYNMSSV